MKIAEYKMTDHGMDFVTRDATPEEEAEHEAFKEECRLAELNREPTEEEKFEAQLLYTALMTDTLI